jgi:hypothetical protein
MTTGTVLSADSFPLSSLLFELFPSFEDENDDELPSEEDDGGSLSDEDGGLDDDEKHLNERKYIR